MIYGNLTSRHDKYNVLGKNRINSFKDQVSLIEHRQNIVIENQNQLMRMSNDLFDILSSIKYSNYNKSLLCSNINYCSPIYNQYNMLGNLHWSLPAL